MQNHQHTRDLVLYLGVYQRNIMQAALLMTETSSLKLQSVYETITNGDNSFS